jgi:hypothetical protein
MEGQQRGFAGYRTLPFGMTVTRDFFVPKQLVWAADLGPVPI